MRTKIMKTLPKLNSISYIAKLPSTGEEIEFRPFVHKEEKALATVNESSNEKDKLLTLRNVIRSCTFDKVDVDNLQMVDFEFLFLKIRSKSVGEISEIQTKCESCEANVPIQVDIDQMTLNGNFEKKMIVPLDDTYSVKLRYPKFIDIVNSSKYKDELTVAIAAAVESIFTEEEVYEIDEASPKEVEEFVNSLVQRQYVAILDELKDATYVGLITTYTCKNGHTHEMEVKGLENFF